MTELPIKQYHINTRADLFNCMVNTIQLYYQFLPKGGSASTKNTMALTLHSLLMTASFHYKKFCMDGEIAMIACTVIAACLHYFYLAVFFIMLVEGIEIAVSTLYVFPIQSRHKWLFPLARIIPGGIVGVSLGISRLHGYGNEKFCWLSVQHGLIWAFVGPVALIIAINVIIIAIVLRKMFTLSAVIKKKRKEKIMTSLRSLGVLLPITGVTWIFGILSVNEDMVVFQYFFTIFNSLQGLFIFIFHCLLNKQIHDAMKLRNRRRKMSDMSASTLRTASSDEQNGCQEFPTFQGPLERL